MRSTPLPSIPLDILVFIAPDANVDAYRSTCQFRRLPLFTWPWLKAYVPPSKRLVPRNTTPVEGRGEHATFGGTGAKTRGLADRAGHWGDKRCYQFSSVNGCTSGDVASGRWLPRASPVSDRIDKLGVRTLVARSRCARTAWRRQRRPRRRRRGGRRSRVSLMSDASLLSASVLFTVSSRKQRRAGHEQDSYEALFTDCHRRPDRDRGTRPWCQHIVQHVSCSVARDRDFGRFRFRREFRFSEGRDPSACTRHPFAGDGNVGQTAGNTLLMRARCVGSFFFCFACWGMLFSNDLGKIGADSCVFGGFLRQNWTRGSWELLRCESAMGFCVRQKSQ